VAEALHRPRLVAKRVLIVEDEPVLRRQLVRHFQGLGVAVDAAGEPEEGAALIAANHYDGAILDLCLTRLGGADGLALLREIRDRDAGTVVVILSANVTDEALRKGLESGAQQVLQKPQSLDDLSSLLLGDDALTRALGPRAPAGGTGTAA
jgi:DNA-binding response OmpR family regulator